MNESVAENGPLGTRFSHASAWNLGREHDPPLGRWFRSLPRAIRSAWSRGAATRRLRDPRASPSSPRCPDECAARAARAPLASGPPRAASRESCRRRSRTHRSRPRAAASIISAAVSPGASGTSSRHSRLHTSRIVASMSRHAAHFGAALHARMSTNGHQPAVRPADEPAREADVDQRFDRLDAVRVLGQPHRPDDDGVTARREQAREAPHLGFGRAARRFERGPFDLECGMPCRVESGGVSRDEVGVDGAVLDEGAQGADEEGEVSAGVDTEPVIRERGAEQRALRDRWHPVAFEPRLAERIDDRDLGAAPLRFVQCTSSSPADCSACSAPRKTRRSASSQST